MCDAIVKRVVYADRGESRGYSVSIDVFPLGIEAGGLRPGPLYTRASPVGGRSEHSLCFGVAMDISLTGFSWNGHARNLGHDLGVPTTSKPPHPNETTTGLENLLWRCENRTILPGSLASPS